MSAEDLLAEVQRLKEVVLMNGFKKNQEVDRFFEEHWMQILDILDDALYKHIYQ